MMKYEIMRIDQIDTEKLTFADLRKHYGTGRAYTISGSGRDRKTGYRQGVMTDIGDIELSDWKKLVYILIERAGEEQMQQWLRTWYAEYMPWEVRKEDQETEALDAHVRRCFDDPKWVQYIEFNQKFRPELLKAATNSENERSQHNNECE